MFTNNTLKASIAMTISSANRYNLKKVSAATVKPKTDRNGKDYYSVEFYALTSKGNTVLFEERRLDKAEAYKKASALNKGNGHIKASITYAEDVLFNNGVDKKLLYGHALNAEYVK